MLHEAEKYIEKSADLKSYEQQKLSHCFEIESADHVLFYLFRCIWNNCGPLFQFIDCIFVVEW